MTKTISMAEVADNYGISLTTIRRYIAAGKLTAYRIGPRMIRLDAAQVERELLQNQIPNGATGSQITAAARQTQTSARRTARR
jgi:excisionase family DNA binding protein